MRNENKMAYSDVPKMHKTTESFGPSGNLVI